MKSLAAATVALLAVLFVGGLAAPAQADIPPNVRDGNSGTLATDWVRVTCATNHHGVRCAVRLPEVHDRVRVVYSRDGEYDPRTVIDATIRTPAYRAYRSVRTASARLAGGLHVVARATADHRLVVTIDAPRRYRYDSVSLYDPVMVSHGAHLP